MSTNYRQLAGKSSAIKKNKRKFTSMIENLLQFDALFKVSLFLAFIKITISLIDLEIYINT